MNRLFIALLIPKEIREKIISLRNKAIKDYNAFRWEPEEKIHLTLKFIGDVKDELTEPIKDALKFISDFNCFNCRLTRFGFFYKQGNAGQSGRQAHVLWIGLSPDDSIYRMVDKINKELEPLSIPAEKRKFQPHLTIKRLKGDEGENFVNAFEGFEIPDIQFKGGEVALIKSDLLPGGSKYTEIKKYNLK